jgi:hypothetical protein
VFGINVTDVPLCDHVPLLPVTPVTVNASLFKSLSFDNTLIVVLKPAVAQAALIFPISLLAIGAIAPGINITLLLEKLVRPHASVIDTVIIQFVMVDTTGGVKLGLATELEEKFPPHELVHE